MRHLEKHPYEAGSPTAEKSGKVYEFKNQNLFVYSLLQFSVNSD